MLNDKEIEFCLMDGSIIVEPKPDMDRALNQVSMDFRLGNRFKVWSEDINSMCIDVCEPKNLDVSMDDFYIYDDSYMLVKPNEMVLAETVERLTLGRDVAAKVSGRSSLGRLGLIVHITADLFAPGWDGVPTLELKNVGPHTLMLKPGMSICAFSFYRLNGDGTNGYSGKYQGQDGVTVSR